MTAAAPKLAIADLAEMLGPAAQRAERLARYTSLRVGGPADLFLAARSAHEMITAVSHAARRGVPWRVIGSASNLLVSDSGVGGLVIKAISGAVRLTPHGSGREATLEADAGCLIAALARQTTRDGWAGLEWAANGPGTVGAAVVNNSGAFGSCTAEHLLEATLFLPGGGLMRSSANDLDMRYRSTRLKRGDLAGVVVNATFRLTRSDPAALTARIREIQRTRKVTQPAGFSVGSVFANPRGDAAGRLIESSGLKGLRFGDAEVSTVHANFIVNRGHASAADVLHLMGEVQHTVWDRWGAWLSPEVQIVGRWADEQLEKLAPPPGGGL